MTQEKSLIKKFRTKDKNYIYDATSNNIFLVNKTIFNNFEVFSEIKSKDELKKKNFLNKSEVEEEYDKYKKKVNEGYFSYKRPVISFSINSVSDIQKELDSGLKQLILELTENCNFRCKYCVYSGKYKKTRVHKKKDMSFSTLKKAIDFFIQRSDKNKRGGSCIGFYGGEPLLKFDLIKKAIEYVSCKNIRFTITTNGSLLNREIINYFIKNNVSITLSLDGPEIIHDRYRVYPDGSGTFKQIFKNILLINEIDKNFFKNKVLFNIVIAPPYNFTEIVDFFYRNQEIDFGPNKINISPVDSYQTSFFKDMNLEDHKYMKLKLLNTFFNKYKYSLIKDEHDQLNIEKILFDKDFYIIKSREMGFLGEKYPPQGMCFPGKRRLFVNTDGKFFMCERTGNNFEIGDIEHGFYYKLIYNFLISYEEFFRECKDCWAIRLCDKCFNSVRNGENLDKERKEEFCEIKKLNVERNLIAFCEIIEKNPNAFDHLNNFKLM